MTKMKFTADPAHLTQAARALRAANASRARAVHACRDAAIAAHAAGTPETVIAEALGVNRMTVRRWLGKS
jgi:hypothetical protein